MLFLLALLTGLFTGLPGWAGGIAQVSVEDGGVSLTFGDRWAAVAAGFLGILIVLKPGSGVFSTDAILPFVEGSSVLKADLDMAVGMIEERVHKTRQFFNAIAEDWDKLSRDVLGGFDLPGAVARHMPACAS